MRIRLGWTGSVFLGAALLTVGGLFVPMTTSLGQGINETVVTGWDGQYVPADQSYHFRVVNVTGSFKSAMRPLPVADFPLHLSSFSWLTRKDFVPAIKAAIAANPHMVEQELGTYQNVAGPLSPFPADPVAYSTAFLKDLAAAHINPASFGGPDIPPGSVPYGKLTGGILHIDTKSDDNTLIQCHPGQIPAELAALNPSLSAK